MPGLFFLFTRIPLTWRLHTLMAPWMGVIAPFRISAIFILTVVSVTCLLFLSCDQFSRSSLKVAENSSSADILRAELLAEPQAPRLLYGPPGVVS